MSDEDDEGFVKCRQHVTRDQSIDAAYREPKNAKLLS